MKPAPHRLARRAPPRQEPDRPEGNKAERRKVVAERTYGTDWVVTSGLNPGDKVITQGTNNLRSGAELKPVPASTPQKIEPQKPGTGGQGKKGG